MGLICQTNLLAIREGSFAKLYKPHNNAHFERCFQDGDFNGEQALKYLSSSKDTLVLL